MNDKLEEAVRAVLKLDPEYDPLKADAAIQVLKGKTIAGMREVEKFDHVMKRREVADLLRVDVHTIDAYVRQKKLRRIPATGRAIGISAISVKEYQTAKALREMGVRK